MNLVKILGGGDVPPPFSLPRTLCQIRKYNSVHRTETNNSVHIPPHPRLVELITNYEFKSRASEYKLAFALALHTVLRTCAA